MAEQLTIPEIQRLWAAIIWARNNGWSEAAGDDQWAKDAEAKLQARFDELEDVRPDCGCGRCDWMRREALPWPQSLVAFMILCPECGNKRCPHADWHGYQCTHSNAVGQTPVPIEREDLTGN